MPYLLHSNTKANKSPTSIKLLNNDDSKTNSQSQSHVASSQKVMRIQKKLKNTRLVPQPQCLDEDDDLNEFDDALQQENNMIANKTIHLEASISNSFSNIVLKPVVPPWDKQLTKEIEVQGYLHDIITNLRESEQQAHDWCKFYDTDYMQKQNDITVQMRTILLNWLIDVHNKFKLVAPSLFLAINMLDRFLARKNISRTKLQLYGCCCLWVSSKYHEIYAPEIDDFVYISDNAFTAKEMESCERDILAVLEYRLTVPTVFCYVQRFTYVANHYLKSQREKDIIRELMVFFVEHAAASYKLCRARPSLVAAAAFIYACIGTKVFSRQQFVDDRIKQATGYTLEEKCFVECLKTMHTIIQESRKSKFRALNKKYSTAAHFNVARLNLAKLKVFLRLKGRPNVVK